MASTATSARPSCRWRRKTRQKEREEYAQSQVNELWRTVPRRDEEEADVVALRFPPEPEENLLYFIEKYAPLLEPWQREMVRITRKISQYFYPQRQTQVMNEGWATFWHYTILNELYKEGIVGDGFMLEFLQSHTNVVYQPMSDQPVLQRHQSVCARLHDDDRHPPHLRGSDARRPRMVPRDCLSSDWRKTLDFAMRNFKDESFIAQYLSPKLIHDFHFFAVLDDDSNEKLTISAIHDERGYREVRQKLADQYNLGNRRTEHPGVAGEHARRPRADLAPHPVPAPSAQPARPGSAQACGASVGLRCPPRYGRPGR
ncbi:SpoVR family protein [Massilia sp. H-1]|nr:SpoVR family protein [Massilia sp. H-1]